MENTGSTDLVPKNHQSNTQQQGKEKKEHGNNNKPYWGGGESVSKLATIYCL